MHFRYPAPGFVLLIILQLIFHSACQKELDPPVIPPSEFSKEQRETLGDKVKIAIAFESERYPVVPNIPPYDETLYWYIQTLYNQVTNTMHLDNQSPSSNRWDISREWEIIILDLPEKNAFVIPGGHLYITTGLLKSLQSDHELYYILAFEATLMNENYLLSRIVSDFNTQVLASIANGTPSPNGSTSKTLADVLSLLDFDETIIPEVDQLTSELICETSRMKRTGIVRLLESSDDGWLWFQTRKNYIGRAQHIIEMEINDCGTFETSGGYQENVLDQL